MPLPDNPGSLSVHRAFVIQFGTRTDVARGAFTGRVEHVVSGQAALFDTLETLLAFIARVLHAGGHGSPAEDR
jgi:hypothetical protein